MAEMTVSIGSEPASDSWGFVGVVGVGEVAAYRTIQSFPTPQQADSAARGMVGIVLGELLATAEWRQVRERTGRPPTREELALGMLRGPGRSAVSARPLARQAGTR